jgi:hypothetical protein
VQLPPVFERKPAVGQNVLRRFLQERRSFGKPSAQTVGDFVQLRHRASMVGLREDRADDRGDRLARALRHRGQQVPHERHPAPLSIAGTPHQPHDMW